MSRQTKITFVSLKYTLPAKSMEYSENTIETLAFDIIIYCEWLGINHK